MASKDDAGSPWASQYVPIGRAIVIPFLLICALLAVISFARQSGATSRFTYASTYKSIDEKLLNADGTPRLSTVPNQLASIMKDVVFNNVHLNAGEISFYNFFSDGMQGGYPGLTPKIWIMMLLQSIGGSDVLYQAPHTVPGDGTTPPPNLLPPLALQGCVGSCYANAMQYSYQAALATTIKNLTLAGGLGEIEPSVIINLEHHMRLSRPWLTWMYKRAFKVLLQDSPLSQGGHPLAVGLAVRSVGAPLEEQYDYPSSYYNGLKLTPVSTESCENCVVYKCIPPHVEDAELSDAFDKYVLPPPGGVVALAKIYGFDRYGVKLLHPNDTVVATMACAFSVDVEVSCEEAYGGFTDLSWSSFSSQYVKTMRGWVSAGFAPTIGIPVFDTWSSTGYSSIIPFPVPSTAKIIGYHAMAVVNFTTTTTDCVSNIQTQALNVYGAQYLDAGCLKLRNSWGNDVGSNGYHWLPMGFLITYLWGGRIDMSASIPAAPSWPFPFATATESDFTRDWQPLLAGGVVVTTPPL